MKLATERLKKVSTVQGGRTLRADVRICVRWRYFQSHQMEQCEEAALHSFSLFKLETTFSLYHIRTARYICESIKRVQKWGNMYHYLSCYLKANGAFRLRRSFCFLWYPTYSLSSIAVIHKIPILQAYLWSVGHFWQNWTLKEHSTNFTHQVYFTQTGKTGVCRFSGSGVQSSGLSQHRLGGKLINVEF